jgi:hypothetical protein
MHALFLKPHSLTLIMATLTSLRQFQEQSGSGSPVDSNLGVLLKVYMYGTTRPELRVVVPVFRVLNEICHQPNGAS